MAVFKTITSALSQRDSIRYPDRSSAIRYALDLVGGLVGRNLLDHVESLLSPNGTKGKQ
ncbi:hypothetical protein A8950_1841 [Dongia mobilis]|uniref:Uncharacterized protein n=1 Tax=Dongia mobilis TaxID=578943 RepID=A0A4R6WRE1_9PROT|nr:hypothetical protein A8950_1841 [Dongia mobilis]